MKQQRKKLGLVLGAGAARGFAHIGVIQSFLEHGLPIDVLTGTSMGALLGGVYATGTDINYIADFSQNVAVSRFLDFSLKDGGIVGGRAALPHAGGTAAEDHRIVASQLVRADAHRENVRVNAELANLAVNDFCVLTATVENRKFFHVFRFPFFKESAK